MRGVSAIDLQTPSGSLLALEPLQEVAPEYLALSRQWGFASDARAILTICLHALDTVIIAGAGIVSHLIRNGSLIIASPYWTHIIIGCLIFSLVMQLAGMYRFTSLRRHGEHLTRITGCWAAVVLLLMAIIYFSKLADEFSRGWILLWAVSGWLGLMGTRALTWRAMRRLQARGQLVTRIAVVGDGAAAKHCAERLEVNGNDDVQVIGVFEMKNAPKDTMDCPASHDFRGLLRFAVDLWIDEIVIALPCNEPLELGSPLVELSTLALDINLYLDFGATKRTGYGPGVLVSIWKRPLAGVPTVFKRCMDLCISILLLAVLLPLVGLIAALIKLDSTGPVLFKQQRLGFNKKPFTLYKFRSMRLEAGHDPLVPQARRNDPRVTRIGRFLRRTSLDELPQLINVLGGDMSLVGPRPHAIVHDEKYATLIDHYLARHRIKPGMTGWAQVNGLRGETETLEKMEGRLQYDLYYIDNWSPLLDLQILCRTLAVVLDYRNAY
jgi:putative colanic acid biosynthesis UDP-glucose lipid carrier transferase